MDFLLKLALQEVNNQWNMDDLFLFLKKYPREMKGKGSEIYQFLNKSLKGVEWHWLFLSDETRALRRLARLKMIREYDCDRWRELLYWLTHNEYRNDISKKRKIDLYKLICLNFSDLNSYAFIFK